MPASQARARGLGTSGGTATSSSRIRMMPAAGPASGRTSMRCASTGTASALMSSGSTKVRPALAAPARAAPPRQGVEAVVFRGVEGGQQEERRRQHVGAAVYRHLPLVQRLQKGGLRAWRGPVDLVPQYHVGEDGAGGG